MKRNSLLVASLILLLSLQGVLLKQTPIRADVGALSLAFVALERSLLTGSFLAALIGYLSDIFAGTSRGLFASSFVLVFLPVRLLVSRFASGSALFVSTVAVACTALVQLVALGLEHSIGPGYSPTRGVLSLFPGLLLSAALLGYPLYRVFKKLDELVGDREDEFVFRS